MLGTPFSGKAVPKPSVKPGCAFLRIPQAAPVAPIVGCCTEAACGIRKVDRRQALGYSSRVLYFSFQPHFYGKGFAARPIENVLLEERDAIALLHSTFSFRARNVSDGSK